MDIRVLIAIIVTAIFINNIVLIAFLGQCSFFGVTTKIESSLGMGMAVTFVITMASAITWVLKYWVLNPLSLGYFQTVMFILVIAALVQFVELFMEKNTPNLFKALGIYLPLITTNCAVLGVPLINMKESYTFIQATLYGFAASVGYTIAMLLLSGIRMKLEYIELPKSVRGLPIAFIAAGILSIGFMGFSGMKI